MVQIIAFSISLLMTCPLGLNDEVRSHKDALTEYVDSDTPTSYCGLYCVFAASHALGYKTELNSIIREKYLSGSLGSTVDDLKRLSEAIGLETKWKSGLSIDDLELASSPVILHVRSPSVVQYSHWVLFLGFAPDGSAKIFDPPAAEGQLSKANLLAIWDGSALTLSRPSEHPFSLPISVRSVLIIVCVFVVIAIANKKLGGFATSVVATLLASVGLALQPEGFAWNIDALRSVSSAHFREELSIKTREQLKRMLSEDQVVLVDARPTNAYLGFHLPTARNIAIGTGEIPLSNALSNLKSHLNGRQVVVYCQSDKCGWADSVGSLIRKRLGIEVSIYREGVNGWRSKNDN